MDPQLSSSKPDPGTEDRLLSSQFDRLTRTRSQALFLRDDDDDNPVEAKHVPPPGHIATGDWQSSAPSPASPTLHQPFPRNGHDVDVVALTDCVKPEMEPVRNDPGVPKKKDKGKRRAVEAADEPVAGRNGFSTFDGDCGADDMSAVGRSKGKGKGKERALEAPRNGVIIYSGTIADSLGAAEAWAKYYRDGIYAAARKRRRHAPESSNRSRSSPAEGPSGYGSRRRWEASGSSGAAGPSTCRSDGFLDDLGAPQRSPSPPAAGPSGYRSQFSRHAADSPRQFPSPAARTTNRLRSHRYSPDRFSDSEPPTIPPRHPDHTNNGRFHSPLGHAQPSAPPPRQQFQNGFRHTDRFNETEVREGGESLEEYDSSKPGASSPPAPEKRMLRRRSAVQHLRKAAARRLQEQNGDGERSHVGDAGRREEFNGDGVVHRNGISSQVPSDQSNGLAEGISSSPLRSFTNGFTGPERSRTYGGSTSIAQEVGSSQNTQDRFPEDGYRLHHENFEAAPFNEDQHVATHGTAGVSRFWIHTHLSLTSYLMQENTVWPSSAEYLQSVGVLVAHTPWQSASTESSEALPQRLDPSITARRESARRRLESDASTPSIPDHLPYYLRYIVENERLGHPGAGPAPPLGNLSGSPDRASQQIAAREVSARCGLGDVGQPQDVDEDSGSPLEAERGRTFRRSEGTSPGTRAASPSHASEHDSDSGAFSSLPSLYNIPEQQPLPHSRTPPPDSANPFQCLSEQESDLSLMEESSDSACSLRGCLCPRRKVSSWMGKVDDNYIRLRSPNPSSRVKLPPPSPPAHVQRNNPVPLVMTGALPARGTCLPREPREPREREQEADQDRDSNTTTTGCSVERTTVNGGSAWLSRACPRERLRKEQERWLQQGLRSECPFANARALRYQRIASPKAVAMSETVEDRGPLPAGPYMRPPGKSCMPQPGLEFTLPHRPRPIAPPPRGELTRPSRTAPPRPPRPDSPRPRRLRHRGVRFDETVHLSQGQAQIQAQAQATSVQSRPSVVPGAAMSQTANDVAVKKWKLRIRRTKKAWKLKIKKKKKVIVRRVRSLRRWYRKELSLDKSEAEV